MDAHLQGYDLLRPRYSRTLREGTSTLRDTVGWNERVRYM